MHRRERRVRHFPFFSSVLVAIVLGGTCGSSMQASALPVTIDYPDTRSYVNENPPPLPAGQLQAASEQLDKTKTREATPVSLTLRQYTVPSERVLLHEVGLEPGPEIDLAIEQAMTWINQSMSAHAQDEFATRCEQNFSKYIQSLQLSAEALACVPWAMEKLNTYVSGGRDNRNQQRPNFTSRVRTESEWRSLLKGANFVEAFWRIDPQNTAELSAEAEIAASVGQNCQYRGAVAAFIARAETFFPEQAALSAIERVYPFAFACLEPDDDGFERTHLRTGLFRLMQGDTQRAKQSLLLASYAENPEEEFRSLFWLGVLEESRLGETSADADNPYWQSLRKRYPLSIHTVISSHSRGLDPFATVSSGKENMIARRVGVSWSEFNLAAFFFELLITRKQATHLAAFARYSSRMVDAPNSEALLFLTKCYSTAQAHKVAISNMTRYFRETQNQGITLETMNLFFPRAYTDQILSSTGLVDPVIVLSLIRQESAFDPFARSVADARGLMQLLPTTASRWLANSRQELYDPSQNVRVGVKYMETLFKRYDGNVEHVLAAYNAGLKNLDRWRQRFPNTNTLLFMDLIPFKETRTYVAVILRNAYWYGRLMALQKDALADTLVKKSTQAKWRSLTVQNLLRIAWSEDGVEGSSRGMLTRLYSLPTVSQ